MPARHPARLTLIAGAAAIALAGCGSGSDARQPVKRADAAAAAPMTEAQMVDEVASALQACSYDGKPVSVDPSGLSAAAPTDCRDMIQKIMDFSGLPQNFEIVEAKVPNAAAMIVLDRNKVPRRVIAFNNDFINGVRRATGQSNWAPVSIMAHEVGHHLSGHTITPGGSQPPIELEADKFSGFVLYRMGAALDDATKAILTLGPPTDGPTHPGRDRRAAAIGDGWKQACRQQGGTACDSGVAAPAREPAQRQARTTPAAAAPVPAAARPQPTDAKASLPSTPAAAAASAAGDVLPRPDRDATPSKFNQFVYDETGLVEPQVRAKYEKEMFEHARAHGVEIVTLVVGDLHGLSGDDYAWAMLRQLRVGKLDVGNGVVLVYAPRQKQVGLAMGPGVALAMGLEGEKDFAQVRSGMARTLGTVEFSCRNGCRNGSSDLFFGRADHIRRDTDQLDWTVRYQSYGEIWKAFEQDWQARRSSGVSADPKNHPTNDRIVRMQGKVLAIGIRDGEKGISVNTVTTSRGFVPVHVAVAEGHEVVLYVTDHVQGLMPGGALKVGESYVFIAREKDLTWNAAKDTQSFYALSYDSVS